ncbi:hypothetical protein OROGR_001512 [Orobanche gracilis]
MATLKYSSTTTMMFMFYSSCLLLASFSCFPDKIQGGSTCKPSTVHRERPSTLEVSYSYGPCSKYSTHAPPLTHILSSDQSRVESIQARFRANTNKVDNGTPNNNNKFKDMKVEVPLQAGDSYNSGLLLVTIGLGSQNTTLHVALDTGSDLTWTQCQRCRRSCYIQNDTMFDPNISTSYSGIPCNSHLCSLYNENYKDYGIVYGDGSSSVGWLGQDSLALTPNDVIQNYTFGCGQNNTGFSDTTAGLIALGRGDLSFVNQTKEKYQQYFSHCFPSNPDSTGYLTLGTNSQKNNRLNFISTYSSKGSSNYFFNITGISVGGKLVEVDPFASAFIDSGTIITRLQPKVYNHTRDVFKDWMTKYPFAGSYSILDTCYDFSNYANTKIDFPPILFKFSGDVTVDLAKSGVLFVVNSTMSCLAFAGNQDDADPMIFGNIQQRTFEVVYDVANEKLGFVSGGCE